MLLKGCRAPQSRPPSWPPPYALPTTDVNHVRSSGNDRHGWCFRRLARGSVPIQPCYHVLNGLPYTRIMCVSQGLECGSHAAAPAVHTIQRVAYRYPSWSRVCWMCSYRSSSRSGMLAIPAHRRIVAISSYLLTSGHSQHLTAVERIPPRRLEACATPPAPRGALAAWPNAA